MDARERKEVLRLIPYGLYAVTCAAGGQTNAFCASWLMQVGFEPPLVLLGVRPDSSCCRLIAESGEFVAHLVHQHQTNLVRRLFQPLEKASDKLAGCTLRAGSLTAPVLAEAVAYFECRVVERHQPGDHVLFVAEVVGAERLSPEPPLLLSDTPWSYGG